MLCDHLEGWDGGWTGREAQEGGSGGIHIAGSHCYTAETNTIWESNYPTIQFSSVQSLTCVGTPRTAACQASVSITSSWSLLKLMSIESMMPSNHLILCCPFSSVQFSSVAQSCLTVCDPMNHSMPGFPVHYQLPESTQIHVHRVGDAIQPSHPLLSPSPPALNLSQRQGLFK